MSKPTKVSAKGVLSRVVKSREDARQEFKKKFGRSSNYDLNVLARFMTDTELKNFNAKYESSKLTPGGSEHTPKPEQLEWYAQHLHFPGSITEYAKSIKQDAGRVRRAIYRTAYWKAHIENQK